MNETTESPKRDLSNDMFSQESQVANLLHYVDVIRKRWPLILAIVSATIVVGVLYTMKATRTYQAQASVVISQTAAKVLTGVQDVMPNGPMGYYDEAFLQTEYRVLSSRKVAARAAEILNLRYDDKHNGLGKISDPKKKEQLRKEFDAPEFVQNNIKINPTKRSQIVTIEVINPDPKFAADLANAVATSYMELNVGKRLDGTKEASLWLASQHEELKKKLESSEEQLYAFMEKNGILNASLESQMEEVKGRLQQFNTKLAEVQAARISGEVDAQTLEKLKNDRNMLDSIKEIQSGDVIKQLKQQLSTLQGEASQLSERYLANHPKVKGIEEQINSIKGALAKEANATIARLERDRYALLSTEKGLTSEIGKEREKEAQMNHLSLEYNRFKREIETNSQLYEMVTSRLKEIDLTGMVQANNVHLMDRAEVPKVAYRPIFARNMALCLILGLMLALAIVLLLEVLDTSIKSQEDIEKYLGVTFLGTMPIIAGAQSSSPSKKSTKAEQAKFEKERDLFIMRNPKSAPAECSRAIRTNLLFMSPDKALKSIVVTSSMPKEGKTTSSIGLAATLAQTGSRVLLVDTDLRRPRLHRSFGFPNDVGISSVIVGEATLEQAIRKSDQPGLDVLVCGPIPPNPAELLHTSRFNELRKELERRYDKVVFDAPPVTAVTDPVILGAQVDGVIFVVKTGYTSREVIRKALRSLLDARVHVYGIVLNDMEISSRRYGYYYSRYYRYGQTYGQYGDSETIATAT